MSTSFLERSRLERKVIDAVNEKFQKTAELDGLAIPTLENWSKKICLSTDINSNSIYKITSLLREISQRISSDSDASKHIFIDGFFSKNSTVDLCLIELNENLDLVKIH